MQRLMLFVGLCYFCGQAFPQSKTADDALLAKTRSLYDAPFTRGLISFDCSVQFDWKAHFSDVLGSVPSAALPTIERLQSIQHRVFVDRSGAVVSTIPKSPDLSDVANGSALEHGFQNIASSGLNSWMPSSTNVILPVPPTKFAFQRLDAGYKLAMNGPGVTATLLLAEDMRITSGIVQQPQPLRFVTDFTNGSNGLVLSSIKTENTSDTATDSEASFAFTYQTVDGFQLPLMVIVNSSHPETWRYTLTDCQVKKGISINVGLPKLPTVDETHNH